MAAILEVIGFISGVLGIIQFGEDNLPEKKSVGSTVRITVGLDTKGGLNNAGGDLPDVRLFNEAGEFLGIKTNPGKVRSGEFSDITIEHDWDLGQQATYALFSANKDAICIAYASITWPSGDSYGWVGDWGRQCGGSWYYSNVYISASGLMPDCLWIDGNNDQPQTGFQVHWPEFVGRGDDSIPGSPADKDAQVDRLCNAGPPFKMHNYPDRDPSWITYWIPHKQRSIPDKRFLATRALHGPSKRPRSVRFRSSENDLRTNQTATLPPMGRSLVIGDSDKHSAEELCESATSFGPDFLNVKTGIFCRMSDKTTWPVCDRAQTTDNCFNNDLNQLVINGVAARDEAYGNIVDWTSEN
ncbi:hypothetical protein O1611_g3000 [Lasiodiplodia mahajangana]|uniref:Uncharacterized protein n=1 Tax=Lasiodiplodia mahajangana TaxID=1108764 RepID=A0ACC2JSZ8_9PEZI|nr:hypothetical protein O1611_g3000 [Lasiodiplodia mahajangana]